MQGPIVVVIILVGWCLVAVLCGTVWGAAGYRAKSRRQRGGQR
jgi:hypothetical protein